MTAPVRRRRRCSFNEAEAFTPRIRMLTCIRPVNFCGFNEAEAFTPRIRPLSVMIMAFV